MALNASRNYGFCRDDFRELTEVTHEILADYNSHCEKAIRFGNHGFVDRGTASQHAADAIMGLFESTKNFGVDSGVTWSK